MIPVLRRPRAAVLGLILLLAGVGFTTQGEALRPGHGGDENLIALDGPFSGRYDSANDTTLVVNACWYCETTPAYLVAGNATGLFFERRLFLHNVGPAGWIARKTEVPPYHPDNAPPTREAVTQAFSGPFVPYDPGWRLALLVGGLALVGAGAAMVLGAFGLAHPASGPLLALAGLGWGWYGATQGDGGGVVFLLAGPLIVVSLALLVYPRSRPHAAGLLAGVVLSIFALVWLSGFYPSAPAI
jgi:hypothetical protein